MSNQPPGNYPPPPPGGFPPPPPPGGGGYQPPQGGGGYQPPHGGGGYQPPHGGGGYPPPQQGGYPPQQGGYPPPPQGGYPPPPPPGVPGGYPPPPPPGAPGYPPPGGQGYGPGAAYSVGDAFSWAWNKVTKHPAEVIVPTLVFGLIYGALQAIIQFVAGMFTTVDSTSYDEYGGSASISLGAGGIAVSVIGALVTLVVMGAIQSAYVGGMLDIANGQPVTIGSFFKPRNVGNVIIASLLSGIIVGIGTVLCIVPGLIAAIMLLFTTVAVIDRNQSGIEGLSTSFNIAKANFGPAALTWLVTILVTIVGALVCLVGLLVAYPVATLITVYAYRRLSGAQVAPLTP